MMRPTRILVVEDYDPFRQYVCSALNQHVRFEVIEASDGLEAVRKIEESPPDLILLDISLPKLNGIQVAKRAREVVPLARILFLSQDFSSELVQEALRLGALGYVQKALAGGRLMPAINTVLNGLQFVAGRMTDTELVNSQGPFTHEAQFYSDDETLLESLAQLVHSALKQGNTAVIVATERHRSCLDRKITSLGIDPQRAVTDGQLVLLDASETLSRILVDRIPDSSRFFDTIGHVVAKANSSTLSQQPVATVFGEMVALLWEDGAYRATICLERLWNELASKLRFSLRCAYPVRGFHKVENSHLITHVCPAHSAIESI